MDNETLIDGDDLLRLTYVAISSKYGMEDCGFPFTMKRLSAFKLVEKGEKGYKITADGLLYLKTHKEDVYMLNHTINPYRKVYFNHDDEDEGDYYA